MTTEYVVNSHRHHGCNFHAFNTTGQRFVLFVVRLISIHFTKLTPNSDGRLISNLKRRRMLEAEGGIMAIF